jgi:serine/threonine-protein kinase
VVHRDLKPSNLFLVAQPGRAPSVKVLDFGISKTADGDAERLTHSHALLASPAYASPEQLRTSHDVDHRADIWSLGVIAYECLTGNLPFRGASLPDLCAHILNEPPLSIRNGRADVPPGLERVVLRCLEKDSAHRYGSVQEFVLALRQFAPGSARKCLAYLRGLEDPDAFNSSKPLMPSSRGIPNAPTRRIVWWGTAALVLGGLGAGAAYVARTHNAVASSHAPRVAAPASTRDSLRPSPPPASNIAPLATAAVAPLISVVPVNDETAAAPPPPPPPIPVRAAHPHVRTPAPSPSTARASASSDTPWVESR